MYRPPPFSFFLCVLILAQPTTQGLAQDAKPDDPSPLKATGLRFEHSGAEYATFSPDGKLLVTTAIGGSGIIVRETATGKTIGEPISLPRISTPPPEITTDGKFLVAHPHRLRSQPNPEVRWWELPGLKPVGGPLQIREQCRVAVGPAGLFLTADANVQAKGNNEFCLRELATGKVVGKPWKVSGGYVLMAAFTPDGKQVFIQGGSILKRYDVKSGTPSAGLLLNGSLERIVFSPDSKFAATTVSVPGGRQVEIQRWDIEKNKPLGMKIRAQGILGGNDYSKMTAIHKDARTVAVTTNDKSTTVQVFDLDTGKALSPEMKHSEPVVHLCFSPDGKRLVTATAQSANAGCWLWDVATGKRIARVPLQDDNFPNFTPGIRVIVFRPDGNALLTGTWGGSLTLWESPAQK